MTYNWAVAIDKLLDGCVFKILKCKSHEKYEGKYFTFDVTYTKGHYGESISESKKDNEITKLEEISDAKFSLYALKKDEKGNHVIVDGYC